MFVREEMFVSRAEC